MSHQNFTFKYWYRHILLKNKVEEICSIVNFALNKLKRKLATKKCYTIFIEGEKIDIYIIPEIQFYHCITLYYSSFIVEHARSVYFTMLLTLVIDHWSYRLFPVSWEREAWKDINIIKKVHKGAKIYNTLVETWKMLICLRNYEVWRQLSLNMLDQNWKELSTYLSYALVNYFHSLDRSAVFVIELMENRLGMQFLVLRLWRLIVLSKLVQCFTHYGSIC